MSERELENEAYVLPFAANVISKWFTVGCMCVCGTFAELRVNVAEYSEYVGIRVASVIDIHHCEITRCCL